MSSASVPVEAMFSTTGLILNGMRSVLAIMHTCFILNREVTMKMNDKKISIDTFVDFINVDLAV